MVKNTKQIIDELERLSKFKINEASINTILTKISNIGKEIRENHINWNFDMNLSKENLKMEIAENLRNIGDEEKIFKLIKIILENIYKKQQLLTA